MTCSIQINRESNPDSEVKWVNVESELDRAVRLAVMVILSKEEK